jgi:hypothetical protein
MKRIKINIPKENLESAKKLERAQILGYLLGYIFLLKC